MFKIILPVTWAVCFSLPLMLFSSPEYVSLGGRIPVVSIEPDNTCISPNYDGVQDYLVFRLGARDMDAVRGWRLQITDGEDRVVREFMMSDRIPGGAIPERIQWDGYDSSGRRLTDGKYRYTFYAWDRVGNVAPVKSGYVIIDCTPPAVKIGTDRAVFSPDGDGKKDNVTIIQNIQTSPDDEWKAVITGSNGLSVKRYEWSGRDVPSKLVWDGKDQAGNLLPDGYYYYSVSASDRAGNRSNTATVEIMLSTRKEMSVVKASSLYYSYGLHAGKRISFLPEVSPSKGLDRWELLISDKDGSPVRLITGTGKRIPGSVDWDCMDMEGKPLRDGNYNYCFTVQYTNGTRITSSPKQVMFDSSQPDIKISHDPGLFCPDSDGVNDYLEIGINASDNTGFDRWEIDVYNESGVLFKKFTGTGQPPARLLWNGIGDGGEIVESASVYDLRFSVTDKAGNISETSDRIKTDVLVFTSERGLNMRISSIEFDYGSSAIKKRGERALDRVYEILRKYASCNVIIECHTDDIGDEEFNLAVSEKRALSVRNYLVRSGISPARIRYVGMGESRPLYPNTDDESRRKNRRVEFFLQKGDERR